MRDFFPSYASVCSLLAISSASFSLRSLDAVLGERRKFDDLSEGRYLKALGHRRGNEKIPTLGQTPIPSDELGLLWKEQPGTRQKRAAN